MAIPFQLTAQQKTFFSTFGYLVFPGLMNDVIEDVTKAFLEVWERSNTAHAGKERTSSQMFVDKHERLCALMDDPRIEGIAAGLLGEDFNYVGSDGNFYVGDTRWHCDSWHDRNDYLKVALYLDPVNRDTGALRVIPGSHVINDYRKMLGSQVTESEKDLGVHGRDVPCLALDSNPGDVVAFHHTLLHASFGGSSRRRMFTFNFCQHYPDDDIEDLRKYLAIFARQGLPHMYGETMVATAGPGRMRHLEQILANKASMTDLAAKA